MSSRSTPGKSRRIKNESPEWKALIAQVPTKSRLIALRPFVKFCVQHGIAPSAVNDHVLTEYETWLRNEGCTRWPRVSALDAARAWNAQTDKINNWPVARIKRSVKGSKS